MSTLLRIECRDVDDVMQDIIEVSIENIGKNSLTTNIAALIKATLMANGKVTLMLRQQQEGSTHERSNAACISDWSYATN